MDDVWRILAQTGDCVWVVDACGRIVHWNPAAREALGYGVSEVRGQLCHQLLAGQTLDGRTFCRAGCPVIQRALRGLPMHRFDLSVQRGDGTRSHVSISIIAIPQLPRPRDQILIAHVARQLEDVSAQRLTLRIYLLGKIAVVRGDGSRVDGPSWRRAKVRMLFAFLALHRGWPMQRDGVLETIWPNVEYSSALHGLTSAVYNLRRSLQPALVHGKDSAYIEYAEDSYVLNNSPNHWVDVKAFESGIAQARVESEPARAVRLYQDSLSLYQGDFLADVGIAQEWCSRERERLRDLHLDAFEELASLYEQEHEYIRAHELYQTILSIDPCRESVCRRLMHLSLGEGNRAAALICYQRLTEALRRELDIAPCQETRQVYETAIEND